MGFLDGKRGIIFGVANERSYAWFIAQQLLAQGAECLFSHLPGEKMERRVRRALTELGVQDPWLAPCDAGKDEEIEAAFARVRERFGRLDFLVHSIAFADRQFLQIGNFHTTTRTAFCQAMDISAYTFLAMARGAAPLMTDGGAMLCMSYYGGEKVIPGYNVMGVAKAALEQTTRYLAAELGEKKIRVNAISGGPLRTLAASAVGDIDKMFQWMEQKAPLRRNITGEEVGRMGAFLLSDFSSGVTGEVVHVDAGFNIMGL